jgi:tetratricopeptide (TPR) repeat protein
MRQPSLIAAGLFTALAVFSCQGSAQQQSSGDGSSSSGSQQQSAPDAPQPQQSGSSSSQSNSPADKNSSGSSSNSKSSSASGGKSSGQSAADKNPFPEDVSRKAAQAAGNPKGSENQKTPSGKQAGAQEKNPFPEDVSRKAAEAAASKSGAKQGKSDASSGEASSADGGLTDKGGDVDVPRVEDPHRAKNDNDVGNFYMGKGDYKGAYDRFADAMKYDPGDIDAAFGAAEAAERLGNTKEALRDYQLYLDVMPNGSKAKRAMKAVNELSHTK